MKPTNICREYNIQIVDLKKKLGIDKDERVFSVECGGQVMTIKTKEEKSRNTAL